MDEIKNDYKGWTYTFDGFYDDYQSMHVSFIPKCDPDAGFIHIFNSNESMADDIENSGDKFEELCEAYIDELKIEEFA